MPRKKKIKLLTFSLIMANVSFNVNAESVNEIQFLRQQILLAESNNRFDIAESALEHWLSIDSESIEVLYLQAQINILKGELDDAKTNILNIETKFPNDPRLKQINSLYSAYSTDKLKLQQARFLSGNQRRAEAIALYQELFPYGMPSVALDVEYINLLSFNTPQDNAKAKKILKERLVEFPYIKEYKLTYANLIANNAVDLKNSLTLFEQLSQSEPYNPDTAASWLKVLEDSPIEDLKSTDIDRLTSAYPYDANVKAKTNVLKLTLAAYNKKINEPGYQALIKGFSYLDESEYDLAEQSFLTAKRYHPIQPQVFLGLGRTKLGQAKYTEALDIFTRGKALRLSKGSPIDWDSLISSAQFSIELDNADKLSEKNPIAAIDLYHIAIAKNPKEITPYIAIAKLYIKLARSSVNSEKTKEQLVLGGTEKPSFNTTALNDSADNQGISNTNSKENLVKTDEYLIKADQYFTKALEIDKTNYQALVGKLDLLFDNNNEDQAYILASTFDIEQISVISSYLADKKLATSLTNAESALQNHDTQTATSIINTLLGAKGSAIEVKESEKTESPISPFDLSLSKSNHNLKTQNPWLTFRIANVLNQLNRQNEANQFVNLFLANNKSSDEISYAYALYLSKNGRLIAALDEINKIDPEKRTIGMIEAQQRLSMNYQFDHFEGLLKQDREKAINYLSVMEDNAENNPILLIKIANNLYDIDVHEHTRKIVNQLKYSNKWPISLQLDYARLLIKLKDFSNLAKVDEGINLKLASVEQIEQYYQIIFDYKTNKAKEQFAKGNIVEAKNLYVSVLKNDPLFISIFKESNTFDFSVLTQFDIDSSNKVSATDKRNDQTYKVDQLIHRWVDMHVEQLVMQEQYSDYPKVKRIQLLVNLEQYDQAERAMYDLVNDKTSEDRALYTASQSALAIKKWELAEQLSYAALQINKEKNNPKENLSTSLPSTIALSNADKKWLYQNTSGDWLAKNVKSDIDELRKKSDGYVTFFPDYRFGTNTNSVGASIDAKVPVDKLGFAVFRVNPVSLEGANQNIYAKDYGTSQLHYNGQNFSTPTTTGVGYNVGWMGNHWVADIGRTPDNFLVSNFVGGLRIDGDVNAFSWAVNASRRPVRNTVLSYAGLSDPYTKNVWGGATQSGVGVSLGFDNGSPVGVWSNWQYQSIDGENLKNNDKIQGQIGIYGAVWKDPRNIANIDLGLNTLAMHYTNNQNEFSYGNGGYFSPQAYASLTLPLTVFGRYDTWAYSVRLSGSYSYSKLEDSLYYPNNSNYQSQASDNGLSSVYKGTSTYAFTYGVAAIVEKRITDHWSIGARAQIQRTLFYNPSNIGLYLKYDFNEHWDSIDTPPKVPNTLVDYADY
ncbi:MAG: cellulose synthase subunit BcsC-related outer membrane protein [Methylococcales bacterium]|nr:cellulose synthase subunit BcsC-related outer membrane protein [Methylococcales bacterium]